jgi:hypothetical protein
MNPLRKTPVTFDELLAALKASGAIRPGSIVTIDVFHAGSCPKLRGGMCTCKPDFRVLSPRNPEREN